MMMEKMIQKRQQFSFGTVILWERLFSPARRDGKMPLTQNVDTGSASH